MQSKQPRKVPRYLSAARASIHTLACAIDCNKQVPSGEELYQVILGEGGDKSIISKLWSLIRLLLAALVDDWRGSVRSRYHFKNSFDLSQSEIGNITTIVEIRSQLHRLGYRRPQFYGWSGVSSSSALLQQRSLAKELVLALGWLVAEMDGFGLARELAWSKRPGHLLPPWTGDTSEAELSYCLHQLSSSSLTSPKVDGKLCDMEGGGKYDASSDDTDVVLSELETVSDLCDLCLLKFGQMKQSMKQLKILSTSRAKVLERIDQEQHRLAAVEATVEVNHDMRVEKEGRGGKASIKQMKEPQRGPKTPDKYQRFLCAKALHIVKSPSRFKEAMNAMSKSCEFADRLIESAELEPSFWKLMLSLESPKETTHKQNRKEKSSAEIVVEEEGGGDDSALSSLESVGTAYEALRREIKLKENILADLEALYRELNIPRDRDDSGSLNHKDVDSRNGGLSLEMIEQVEKEVDSELEQLYQPLFALIANNNELAVNKPPEAPLSDTRRMPTSSGVSPPVSPSTMGDYLSPFPSQIPFRDGSGGGGIIEQDNPIGGGTEEDVEVEVKKVLGAQAHQEKTQMTVLHGALKLLQPHLPQGVQPIKFETVRQRKRRQAE